MTVEKLECGIAWGVFAQETGCCSGFQWQSRTNSSRNEERICEISIKRDYSHKILFRLQQVRDK